MKWIKDDTSLHTFRAETVRYRFIMIAPVRAKTTLWVQHVADDWGKNPIDQRLCRGRRVAEQIAQRFDDKPVTPRRLR